MPESGRLSINDAAVLAQLLLGAIIVGALAGLMAVLVHAGALP